MHETWKRLTTLELFGELKVYEHMAKSSRVKAHRKGAREMVEEIWAELVKRNAVANGF